MHSNNWLADRPSHSQQRLSPNGCINNNVNHSGTSQRKSAPRPVLGSDSDVTTLLADYSQIGSTIDSSKVKYVWMLAIKGIPYRIDFVNSKLSGKKKIYQSGIVIHNSVTLRASKFHYTWPIDDHLISIVPTHDGKFELRVNGISLPSALSKTHNYGSTRTSPNCLTSSGMNNNLASQPHKVPPPPPTTSPPQDLTSVSSHAAKTHPIDTTISYDLDSKLKLKEQLSNPESSTQMVPIDCIDVKPKTSNPVRVKKKHKHKHKNDGRDICTGVSIPGDLIDVNQFNYTKAEHDKSFAVWDVPDTSRMEPMIDDQTISTIRDFVPEQQRYGDRICTTQDDQTKSQESQERRDGHVQMETAGIMRARDETVKYDAFNDLISELHTMTFKTEIQNATQDTHLCSSSGDLPREATTLYTPANEGGEILNATTIGNSDTTPILLTSLKLSITPDKQKDMTSRVQDCKEHRSNEYRSNEYMPTEYRSNQYRSNEHRSNEHRSNEHRSNEDRSNEHRSNEHRSNEYRSNEYRSNEHRSNEYRSNEYRSNEHRSNEDRSNEYRSNGINSIHNEQIDGTGTSYYESNGNGTSYYESNVLSVTPVVGFDPQLDTQENNKSHKETIDNQTIPWQHRSDFWMVKNGPEQEESLKCSEGLNVSDLPLNHAVAPPWVEDDTSIYSDTLI